MKQYLTVPEAAGKLSMSESQLYRLIRAGKVPALDVGAGDRPSYRVNASAVELALSNSAATSEQRGHGKVRSV